MVPCLKDISLISCETHFFGLYFRVSLMHPAYLACELTVAFGHTLFNLACHLLLLGWVGSSLSCFLRADTGGK
jgi:hypothetical protein